jgi:hypothetical protein
MLNHNAIVTVYDFEMDADEAFLIMEHVDGASLEQLLDDVGGALTIDETAAVVKAVGSALEFAHENGVLHLDIKPANVLVARDGRVKVADFGMAALSTATGHGAGRGGTIGYMPLEQLEGLHLGDTTDEWAFAVLAYECLTGDNPFDAEDIPSAIVQIETLDPPRASAYEPDLPRAIDEILFAGTGPRPADRYPSVDTFCSALMPHLGDYTVGRDSLAELVSAYAEQEIPAEEPGWGRVGLWDRMQGAAGAFAVRGVAAVESGWLAWAGLLPLGLQTLPLAAAVTVVAVVGALSPSLGTGLGLIAFAVGLFAWRLWLLGSVFVLGSAAWWWFVARRSAGAAVLPLSAPVLSLARVPLLTPLLAGFSLPPLPAAAAGLAGGFIAVLASAASAVPVPYLSMTPLLFIDPRRALLGAANVQSAFANPATWFVLLGWAVAAAVMSLLCRPAKRLWAVVGTLLAGAILYGAYTGAAMIGAALGTKGALNAWAGPAFTVSLVGSLILVLLVAALGAPVRAEEDLVRPAYDPENE